MPDGRAGPQVHPVGGGEGGADFALRTDPEDATQGRFIDWAAMNEQLTAVEPESAEVRAWT